MSSTDSTSAAALLQEYYTEENIRDITYEENARHAVLRKKTDCSGKYYVQPVKYGLPTGRSRRFTGAQSNKGASASVDFIVPWRSDFATHSITRKVIKESQGDASFEDMLTSDTDGMLKRLTRSCAMSEYRGSGGAMGQVNSSWTSGAAFTLADPEEVTNFEVGDYLCFSAGNGDTSTDTLIDAGGTAQITAINRDTGAITLSSLAALPSFAASLYVFKDGDFQASINGFLSWNPATAPGASDSFLGVNRSVDSKLGGNRQGILGLPIKEAVKRCITRTQREGGKPTHVWMNLDKYQQLEGELGDSVRYVVSEATGATVGFEGIRFAARGIGSPIMVHPDINCPNDIIAVENIQSTMLVSLGPVPDLVDDDGVTMLRDQSQSGFELRGEYYANMTRNDTADSCVGDFNTAPA